MKHLVLMVCICITTTVVGQFTVTMMGEVTLDKNKLENCHVVNKNTGIATITDHNGNFFINVSEGDMLRFTHISANSQNVFISKQHVKRAMIAVAIEKKNVALAEVTLSHNKRITAATIGLPNAGKPIPTANERRLATAGDFKAKDLLKIVTQLRLPIDPILNAINGRTARIKKHIEADERITIGETLVWYYEEWLRNKLNLSEEDAIQFIDYLTDDEKMMALLQEENELKVQIYLIDQYEAFQKLRTEPPTKEAILLKGN